MSRKGNLKPEVADGIREIKLGAYKTAGIQDNKAKQTGTAVYGTVRTVVWELGEGNLPRLPDPGCINAAFVQ